MKTNAMTTKEMLRKILEAAPSREHIKTLAKDIIHDTFDYTIEDVDDVVVSSDLAAVKVIYAWNCRGDHGHEEVNIPAEWFDEGFDYQRAYKEMLLKKEKERLKEEARQKAAAKAKKAEEERKLYLKLKKKYEKSINDPVMLKS